MDDHEQLIQELSELLKENWWQELLYPPDRDTGAHLLPTQDTTQPSLHLVPPEAPPPQDSTSSLGHVPRELHHASPETSVGDTPALLQDPAPSAHNTTRSTRMAVSTWNRWCTKEGIPESSILEMPEDRLKLRAHAKVYTGNQEKRWKGIFTKDLAQHRRWCTAAPA